MSHDHLDVVRAAHTRGIPGKDFYDRSIQRRGRFFNGYTGIMRPVDPVVMPQPVFFLPP